MIPHTPLRLFAALTLASASWLAHAADLTVAYQTTVDPAKVAQVDGDYEKASKASIDWRKFDNGADVITAVASGDVQIGYLGSSPLAAAATRKLPVETFLIATQIGAGEALVARDSIKTPQDLIGKKIAVPFVSTGHYCMGSMCLLLEQNKKNKYRFIYNLITYRILRTKKPRTRRGFLCAATTYLKA